MIKLQKIFILAVQKILNGTALYEISYDTLLLSYLIWVMEANTNDQRSFFLKALAEKMIKVLQMMNGCDKRGLNT